METYSRIRETPSLDRSNTSFIDEFIAQNPLPPREVTLDELNETVTMIKSCLDGGQYDPNDELELQESLEFFREWRSDLSSKLGAVATAVA